MSKPQFTLSAGAHNVVAVYTDGIVATTAFIPYSYFPMTADQLEGLHNTMKQQWEQDFQQMLAYMETDNSFVNGDSMHNEDKLPLAEIMKSDHYAPPIMVKFDRGEEVTQADLDKLAEDLQQTILAALTAGEAIPYNEEGCERVQQMFKESYDRVMAGKHDEITITVYVER